MARNKKLPRKLRLIKARSKANNPPSWVIIKTKGRIRHTPYSRRSWRTQRLKT